MSNDRVQIISGDEKEVRIKKLEPVPHRTKNYITTQDDRDYQDYISYVDQNYNNSKDQLTGGWHSKKWNAFDVVIGNDSYDKKNTKGWYE